MNISIPLLSFKKLVFVFFLITFSVNAQVGIGTIDPDPSSILDIRSDSQGLLVPRMTTLQRTAIASPANSLMVYDTDLNSFYYYDANTSSGSWVKINADVNERNNYKLIKSPADLAPELAAGGGTKYLLNEDFFYEINGIITLAAPIDLNNAYLGGLDANEDVLFRSSGPVFEGTSGGSIRNITITGGGTAFNITGGNSLLVQNTIIAGMESVGSISGLQLYFGNIIQFVNNSNGITYSNIEKLLLNNQAWFSSNNGTYETYTGIFEFIEKVSGFSTVEGSNVAMDFSTNPAVGSGTILGHVFSGTGNYVDGYSGTITFPGFNFSNAWTVDCPGIPLEADRVATGNIYLTGTPLQTPLSTTPTKLNMTTMATEMFRTASPAHNRIIYTGSKTRKFSIVGSFSIESASSNSIPIISIAKNGNVITATRISVKMAGGGDVQALSITGTITLAPGDYIELFGESASGTMNLKISSLNLLIY